MQGKLDILRCMDYSVQNDSKDLSILQRLLAIRGITTQQESFLNPTYKEFWQDFSSLSDINAWASRIAAAITNWEKIMVFGDYDVDGISASYIMYTILRKYLWHHTISVRLPHRMHDGYGIKSYHIDQIKEDWCSLIITVDNWISAVEEAKHAQEIWIDLVITDHHQALDTLPEAVAVINPQISDSMGFKELCGATVALKICLAVADKLNASPATKKAILQESLPYVTIATIADCMPLLNENRLLVKKGFEQINSHPHTLSIGFKTLLDTLGIRSIDSYDVSFKIAPMLNATGRVDDALEWLKSFLFTDPQKVRDQIAYMDSLNTERKIMQQQMVARSMEMLTWEEHICIVADDDFHEGIWWIVAWRIAERTKKPSWVLCIKRNEWLVTWSFRGPEGFDVVAMLKSCEDILERFGGHAQAWWVTLLLDKYDEFVMRCEQYWKEFGVIWTWTDAQLVDTYIYDNERNQDSLQEIAQLWPFGEGNPEPMLCVEWATVTSIESFGSWEKKHLKAQIKKWSDTIWAIRRWKWELVDNYLPWSSVLLFWSIKKDTYRWGIYFWIRQMVPVV